MKFLAQLVSAIFHPLFLPVIGALIIVNARPDVFQYFAHPPGRILLILFFNMVLLPLVVVLMMKPLGFIKNLQLEERQERILPFIAGMFFYIWTFILVYKEDLVPAEIDVIVLALLIALVLTFMGTVLFFKISIHTVGMGWLVGYVLSMAKHSEKNLSPVLLLVIVLAGVVGTARLYLNSHNTQELYLGYLIGLLSQFVALQFIF